ncbi:HNH endonuclease [Rhizobium sp. 12,4]|uniref:HNH endonuclease n=1 Tax=Rhizobium sp. 12,4 TaxID=3405135 RepID=UPI003D3595D4
MQPLDLAKPRKRERIPQGVRFDVFRRDNFTCVYCGRGSPEVTLHCDHKIAHSKGGSDDKENLVTACEDCNLGKGAKSVNKPTRIHGEYALVGLFGHTRNDDGTINWQFEIVGKVGDDAYAIQLFSWLDGRPTDVKIFTVRQISACSLYNTRHAWIQQWSKEMGYTYGEAA